MIKGRIEDGLGEVTVRIEVRPLALALETAGNRIVADHFFLTPFGEIRVAVHEVLDDQVHLQGEFPVLILLFSGPLQRFGVLIKALFDILCRPGFQLLELFLIVNAFRHAPDNLDLVDGFHSHAQVFFDELAVDDGAAYAHADRADLQIALAAHGGDGNCRSGKAEQLFLYVFRNDGVVGILNITAVDTEGGKPFLRIGCKHGCQINGARTLRRIQTPDSFDGVAVRIHGF